jgi:mRNA-degrading endonuclease RelE of RelBE toxin-antitoxin system
MKPKRSAKTGAKPEVQTPKTTPAIRIGWDQEAKDAFDRLPRKVQKGLRRKLRDYAENPAIAKPLIEELQAWDRVTYARYRCITRRVEGVLIVVYVLQVALRKDGAQDDPYEIAAAALARREPQILEALQKFAAGYIAGSFELVEEDP